MVDVFFLWSFGKGAGHRDNGHTDFACQIPSSAFFLSTGNLGLHQTAGAIALT